MHMMDGTLWTTFLLEKYVPRVTAKPSSLLVLNSSNATHAVSGNANCKKAANEKITPVGRKRPREAGQAPDGRPAKRARANGAQDDINTHDFDDEEGNFERVVHVIRNSILTNSNLTLGS